MAMIMQAMQAVMRAPRACCRCRVLPPPQVIKLALEMLRMFLHPVRYSRGVVEMIDDFQEQLTQQQAMMR